MKTNRIPFLLALVLIFLFPPNVLSQTGELVLGITWDQSELVSFDPVSGVVTGLHAYLDPSEDFRGLAYDPNHNKLYALSQVSWNLYEIDPSTLNISFIGRLDIDEPTLSADIGGLAYNPLSDVLHTSVNYSGPGGSNVRSELVSIDTSTARTTKIGFLADGYCDSLVYGLTDGKLYGILREADMPPSFVSIDPGTGTLSKMFYSPLGNSCLMLGLAGRPGENLYTWMNCEDGHFYGEINLASETVTRLAPADSAGVASDAMILQDFTVASLQNVSRLSSFKIHKKEGSFTSASTDCPDYAEPPLVGKRTFEATLKNSSKAALSGLMVAIEGLPEGAVVLDSGGTSMLALPREGEFSDGVLGRRESAGLTVEVCVTDAKPFHLSAHILGVVLP